jgi:hypothetical protein
MIFFNFWCPCKNAGVSAATRQQAHLVCQRGLVIQHRCLQVNVLSRCCFPSQDTKLAFISIKTARLVCCEHRGHRNSQINKRIANTLEYSRLFLHSVQLLLWEQEDSSGYVYMGDPKQIRHFAYNTRYTCRVTNTMHYFVTFLWFCPQTVDIQGDNHHLPHYTRSLLMLGCMRARNM